MKRKLSIITFTFLALLFPVGAYASASITYDFTPNNNLVFTINFNKGYSKTEFHSYENEFLFTFDTSENIEFEDLLLKGQNFFESPITKAWLISDGNKKKLHFAFEQNKFIEPDIVESEKKITISFPISTVSTPEAPSSMPGFKAYLRMFFGLGVIIVIILVSYALMKVFFKSNAVSDIPGVGRMLGKVNLDVKKHLIFYELGEIIYIMGVTDNNISLVDKIIDPVDVNIVKAGFAKRKDFSSYMKFFKKDNEVSQDLKDTSDIIEEKLSSIRKK